MTTRITPAPIVVIGSQKSGTTTLMQDLMKCGGFEIDFSTKEESILLKLDGNSKHAEAVHQFFTPKNSGNRVVDVSTLYTKHPQVTVDVKTVANILPNVQLIYIVREPMARALSHYQQDKLIGKTTLPVEQAITVDSKYMTNSLYGQQLSIWAEHIDTSRILLVKFEDYVADRQKTVDEICTFAGITQKDSAPIDTDAAFNVTKNRPKFHPIVHKILATDAYHKLVRKNLPSNTREKIKIFFSIKNNAKTASISLEQQTKLTSVFQKDHEKLLRLYPKAPNWE